jgi:transcriptional regulator with XRE-family HTH domain
MVHHETHSIEQHLQVLASNLERRMHDRGMTEYALAKESGVSKRTVGNFLRPSNRKDKRGPGKGEPSSGTLTCLCKIAAALDVQAWEVMRITTTAQDQFHATIEAAIEAAYQERRKAETLLPSTCPNPTAAPYES